MNPWKKNRLDSPCKFWLDGYCPRSAEECEFAHAGTVVKVPKLCKFYMDSRCVKAKACAFLHETYPCADFVVGRCQLGSDCKLSHAPLDDESTAMVKEVGVFPSFGMLVVHRFIVSSMYLISPSLSTLWLPVAGFGDETDAHDGRFGRRNGRRRKGEAISGIETFPSGSHRSRY